MRSLLIFLLSVFLAACGFQLRGSYTLPWETIYLDLPESDELYIPLRQGIETTTQTRLIDNPKQAGATLVITRNSTGKNILSLSAKGRVREFQLTRIFVYEVRDATGKVIQPANHIILQRDLTFDDTQVYAKEVEENIIKKDMNRDIVLQLLRRLAAPNRSPGM